MAVVHQDIEGKAKHPARGHGTARGLGLHFGLIHTLTCLDVVFLWEDDQELKEKFD